MDSRSAKGFASDIVRINVRTPEAPSDGHDIGSSMSSGQPLPGREPCCSFTML